MEKKVMSFYTLSDPLTKEIKYVGRSYRLKLRFTEHLTDKTCKNKYAWILNLRNSGLTPIFNIVCTTSSILRYNHNWIEKQLCIKYIKQGNNLFNNERMTSSREGDRIKEFLFGTI